MYLLTAMVCSGSNNNQPCSVEVAAHFLKQLEDIRLPADRHLAHQHTPLYVFTDCQVLKSPLPLSKRTATLTKYCCPTDRPVMLCGEEEGVLGSVV